jgi:hypothetical protein
MKKFIQVAIGVFVFYNTPVLQSSITVCNLKSTIINLQSLNRFPILPLFAQFQVV